MSSNSEEVRAVMIIEVAGRPKEHLTQTLNKLIEGIEGEKGVKIEEKKVNEPNPIKDKKDFYTSFAEVEITVDELPILASLMFKYMPSHIEIISPETISITNNTMGEILSELTRRLHGYDEIARVVQVEKAILEKKLKALTEGKEEAEKKE